MKRKILIFALLVLCLATVFAVSVSAKEWTYKDEAGKTYLTLTIDDSSKIITEYEGRFPMWDEKGQPLTWYVIATDDTNGVKTVKGFVSTDPLYTNHGNNYFRFIKSEDFTVEGYPVPTRENVVSLNMPNDKGITAFSNYSNVNFHAGTTYTPDAFELLFLRCPNTLTNTDRLVQSSKVLEVEFDKNSTFTELSHLAFHESKSLRKVNIPASVKKILSQSDNNGRAFYKCESLDQLTFDEGSQLEVIQSGAFKGAKLKEIQLPSGITTLENNMLSYITGLEVIRLPEFATHFVNTNSNGSVRGDHHSFSYGCDIVTEWYIPVTFYATMPDTVYRSSYAFYGGKGNVKFFYCGTAEQFEIARSNFKNGTSNSWDNNGNFNNATLVSWTDYSANPSAYQNADYVICGYNSCDAFHGGVHSFDNDCTTADACKNGCGLTASKADDHDFDKTLVFLNGFTADGTYTCDCINNGCTVADILVGDEQGRDVVPAIFTAKGYSTNPEKNAINGGYTVNPGSLALYKALKGEIKYGVVIANANSFDGEFFDKDNKVNTTKSIQTEIDSQYNNFSVAINFGSQTGVELDLVICAYVITDDGVAFIQKDSGSDVTIGGATFKSVTLAQVVALAPAPAPASKEN